MVCDHKAEPMHLCTGRQRQMSVLENIMSVSWTAWATSENHGADCKPATPACTLGYIKLMTSCVTELLNGSSKWCSTLPLSCGRMHRVACRGKDLQSSSLLQTSSFGTKVCWVRLFYRVCTCYLLWPTSCRQGEYAKFADRVLASHDRAYILHISPAMRETLAEMQACLNQQCDIAACRHPDMMARLIAEKFAAMNPKILLLRL